jgi:glycosyltransferase involved in cell wall biosynthesis
MAKLPVSVCLISGAEVGRIGRALESAADWASEVIVVLNEEVHDGTEALCLAHGAKVYREPWKGYVGQKNSAADKASCPWILSLDADEEVTPALWNEIATTLASPAKNGRYAAFDFPRYSFYCGRWIRHGDWYPDRVRRLWRKGSAAWAGIDIHERLQVEGAIGHLRSDLLR